MVIRTDKEMVHEEDIVNTEDGPEQRCIRGADELRIVKWFRIIAS